MTEPRPPSKRGERLIGDIVREVETVGPNVAEVARRLKLPEERVRRCYRSRVLKNGFHLIARSDWGALGLRPVRVVADISKTYAKYASDIFYAMDNRWFFLEFDRLFPDGKFNIAFLLPEEHYGEFPRILAEMEGMGFLETVHETYHPRWRIVTPMRAELFDFKRTTWNLDWSNLPSVEPPSPSHTPRQELDSVDVSMIIWKELNATSPISGFAKRSSMSVKTAYSHLAHVRDRKLIGGYRVLWAKNQMNQDTNQPRRPMHRYAPMIASFTGISDDEQTELRRRMNALPFLAMEMGGDSDYSAFLIPPLEQTIETMAYLREAMEPTRERSHFHLVDMTCATRFTIQRLYDDSNGRWFFDIDDQMARLRKELETVRKENRLAL